MLEALTCFPFLTSHTDTQVLPTAAWNFSLLASHSGSRSSLVQCPSSALTLTKFTVLVGDSDDWKESVVGMLVSSLDVGAIDLRDVDGQTIGKYLDSILDLSKQHGGVTETSDAAPVEAFKAPKKGDHVLAFHHPTNCFYLARGACRWSKYHCSFPHTMISGIVRHHGVHVHGQLGRRRSKRARECVINPAVKFFSHAIQ